MRKLIVIGIDGGTFNVIKPIIKMGKLPNFKKILKNGVHGPLKSTFPPITGPAWFSLATGKNPGKTGIYDFIYKGEKGILKHTINSNDFKKHGAFWNHLNENDFRSYILNYPMLYPYYDIDGGMVGGFTTPNTEDIANPEPLEELIKKMPGTYPFRVDWHDDYYVTNKEEFVDELKNFIDKQFAVVDKLLNDKWDFMIHVSNASDFLQHLMWEDWENKNSNYRSNFIWFWEELDKKLGNILDKLPDANIFLISDHGFGQLRTNFNLANWLLKQNLIRKRNFHRIKKTVGELLNKTFEIYKNSFLSDIFKIDKEILLSKVRNNSVSNQLNLGTPIPYEIDVSKSKVVPHSSGMHGAIYIKDDAEIELNYIKKIMKKVSTNYNLNIGIYTPEDLYNGEELNYAPDIQIKIDNYKCNIQSKSLEGEVFSNNVQNIHKNGSHRRHGIFCGYGPDIKTATKLQNLRIYDIAPTILHYYDIPIPKDVDGRVLKEIFKENSELYKREIKNSKKGEKNKLKEAIQGLNI